MGGPCGRLPLSLSVSLIGIGCPVDGLDVFRGELAPVEGTRPRPVFHYRINTLFAEQVAAWQHDFYVVPILRAAPTSHLWFPQLVLHHGDIGVVCHIHCSTAACVPCLLRFLLGLLTLLLKQGYLVL